MERKPLSVDGKDGGETTLRQFGRLFNGAADSNDRDTLTSSSFQHTYRSFSHQCLTVNAAFTRHYEVAPFEKFIKMEGIEHQFYSPTKGSSQECAEGSAQATGSTGPGKASHIHLIILSDDFCKMMHPSVETLDHLLVGTFLRSEDMGSSLRTTEGIGDIASYADFD